MTHQAMHDNPYLSWQPVADIEGVSLLEGYHFRLTLSRAFNTARVRLLQQQQGFPGRRGVWLPVVEMTGSDADSMLRRGRAIAYDRLPRDDDYIDWDDDLSPDLYPQPYCYICEAYAFDCLHTEEK